MAAGIAARFAGKTLADFLRAVSGATSAATEQAVLGKLAGSQEFVDAPGLMGLVARHPEATAKVAGSIAPVALAGTALAGYNLLSSPPQKEVSVRPQRQPAFASSAYMPGSLPMTNEQAGEALLDQQRFQHQLQLIQARQNLNQSGGSLQTAQGSNLDIIGLSKQMFAPANY